MKSFCGILRKKNPQKSQRYARWGGKGKAGGGNSGKLSPKGPLREAHPVQPSKRSPRGRILVRPPRRETAMTTKKASPSSRHWKWAIIQATKGRDEPQRKKDIGGGTTRSVARIRRGEREDPGNKQDLAADRDQGGFGKKIQKGRIKSRNATLPGRKRGRGKRA